MKQRYGIAMNTYGKILLGTASLSRITVLSKEAKRRLGWIDYYRSHDSNARLTCRHFGISPDTFYRWLGRYNPRCLSTLEDDKSNRTPHSLRQPETDPILVAQIKKLRERYPRWGKKKLWKLITSKTNCQISISTVGRTLTRLRAKGLLKEPAIVTARLAGQKRRRYKRPYAVPRPWDYIPKVPGDLVQLDTVHVYPIPGQRRYQFTASDYIAKHTARVAASAISAKSAKKILDAIGQRFPYAIKAIQIDGGSEFKAEFEKECQQRNIMLFVLPPRSPKLNGVVERMQRTSREEIYDIKTIPFTIDGLNELLAQEDHIYNHIRPHDSLALLTPNEYYLSTLAT